VNNWNGFAASVPGSGHIRYGLPCQGASAVYLSPRPARPSLREIRGQLKEFEYVMGKDPERAKLIPPR
jgi:hypothetical protein